MNAPMNALLKNALALAGAAFVTQAIAQVSFYEQVDFGGRSFTTQTPIENFGRYGFNDRASSVIVTGNVWEVCEDARFGGRCVVLRPGRYPSLVSMGLNDRVTSVRAVDRNARIEEHRYAPVPVAAQVTFYEAEGFGGRTFTTDKEVDNFRRFGFNDRASSVTVVGERWEVCDDTRFRGRCAVLRPGKYPSLSSMGMNNRVSSVREVVASERIAENRYAPAPVVAQITFYEAENFGGRSFTTEQARENFSRVGFNDRASSVVVVGERWEVCDDTSFRGSCAVLRPGNYPSLSSMRLNNRVSSVREVAANERIAENRYAPVPVIAQITFYENENFGGKSFTTEQARENFLNVGFNDRASSMEVVGQSWEACEHAGYQGRCVLLRAGRYPTMASMGLDKQISSVKIAGAAAPVANRDYRRRQNERTYEADVTSVKAVVGTPEQRCWVEAGQVEAKGKVNIPGAIAGAILGGILGHQVGGGVGKDVATAGGAVAGAVVGANVGRTSGGQTGPDVKRCEDMPGSAKADYWDVSYVFRGQEHRVQMTAPPAGPTITVNEQGEPRA